MFNALFNTTVNVYRAASAGRDSLNNPIYGDPVTGAGWAQIYTAMPCKLDFSSKILQFAQTGERPEPSGVMYIPNSYSLTEDDRIITSDASPIQYVVVSVEPAYLTPMSISHYEAVLILPT